MSICNYSLQRVIEENGCLKGNHDLMVLATENTN